MSSRADGPERDIRISKTLSYILRHGAVIKGLNIRPDGYVNIDQVLKVIPECSINDIRRVVENNDKQRFALHNVDNVLMIKANQGHTIKQVDCLNLKHLTQVSFDIIHGMYMSCFQEIKTLGLSRMKRNHIHFAKGLNFICGLRRNAEIFIYINYLKANADGIQFYESDNGVILSPGNIEGFIKPKYFLKIITKSGKILNR